MFEQLDYIREEGRFKWNDKVNSKRRNLIGKYAGTIQQVMGGQSCRITINRKSYNEGALVWLMEHNKLPKRVFYRDGNQLNNHISNIMVSKNDRIRENGIVCSRCELLLNLNLFSEGSTKHNKYICKSCVNIKNLAHYALNRNTVLNIKAETRQYNHAMRQIEAQEQHEQP